MLKGTAEIFKNDLTTIIKNPIVIIALIIIICLPSLYSIINISAVHDPYNETSNMKIAVVDNDAGYTTQGINYNFGETLSRQIAANNTNFNWQFVDENTARNGVKNGEYYAAFIIPSNFTQTLLSIQTSNPQQAQIDYIVNEKLNPISPRLTNTTANTLQSQINLAVEQAKINLTTAKLNPTTAGNTNGIISFSNTNQNDPNINPVALNTERINPVDNYGTAIAPFYIALSLFIGCIVSIAMLTTRVKNGKKYNHASIYIGKMGIFIIISILQSLIIALSVLNLHIQITSATLLTLTLLYIGLCFMIIGYSLTSAFGNLGKAFAIIILVLQIMTTGGTFPIQLLPQSFQAISPYLPLTYAIEALRQVTVGVLWNTYWYNLEILALFPAIIFAFTLLIKEKLDKYAKWTETKLGDSGLF